MGDHHRPEWPITITGIRTLTYALDRAVRSARFCEVAG
jgi:hypothetical protein